MIFRHSGWANFFVLLLSLWLSTAALADSGHPLEPMDLSSPRATLGNFLATGDALLKHVRDKHWKDSSREAEERVQKLNASLNRMLDLREFPPASRYDLGRDVSVYLYEVLSRIELPPEADIPDAALTQRQKGARVRLSTLAQRVKRELSASQRPGQFHILRSPWFISQVGPHKGQFQFSFSTVLRVQDFYEKVSTLPYRRDVPIKTSSRSVHNLNRLFAPATIEKLPEWLKRSVSQQAVWKWLVVAVMLSLAALVIRYVHFLALRGATG